MRDAIMIPIAKSIAAAITLAAFLSFSAHGQANHTDPPSPEERSIVQPAADAVFAAFHAHSLVGISDNHGLAQEMEFYEKIVRDPRFARDVGNVVVEFGGAARQDVIDRYVNGEIVPYADLRQVWTDTVGWLPTVVYLGYAHFFTAVRETNSKLPPQERIKVWLGEPSIIWSSVHTQAEYMELDATRDSHAAEVIVGQVLNNNKKALVIYGGGHMAPSGEESAQYLELKKVDPTATPSRRLRALVEASYPGAFFIVRVYTGFENRACTMNFERRFARWSMPAMAVISSGSALERDMRRCGRPSGLVWFYAPNEPQAFRDFRERQIDNYLFLADAVLFLGSEESLTKSPIFPDLYLDEQYRQEISRQMEIKTGKPLSATWGRNALITPEPLR